MLTPGSTDAINTRCPNTSLLIYMLHGLSHFGGLRLQHFQDLLPRFGLELLALGPSCQRHGFTRIARSATIDDVRKHTILLQIPITPPAFPL